MNAILAIDNELPRVLKSEPRAAVPRRRSRVGAFSPNALQLDRFNVLLHRLGWQQPPLETDRLATAAREIRERSGAGGTPDCIAHQLRRAAALRLMTSDQNWTTANGTVEIADLVMTYLRSHDDLIPDRLPGIGRFDDAIVVDTAWPHLEDEVEQYLDFCRVRAVEARLRGVAETAFGFTRDDWEAARHAEVELARQRRRIREGSYLPAPAARFLVR